MCKIAYLRYYPRYIFEFPCQFRMGVIQFQVTYFTWIWKRKPTTHLVTVLSTIDVAMPRHWI